MTKAVLTHAGRRHGRRDVSGGRLVTRRNRWAPPSDLRLIPMTMIRGLMSNVQPWLILSHLAGQRMAIEREGKMQRVDYTLLIEVTDLAPAQAGHGFRRPGRAHPSHPGIRRSRLPRRRYRRTDHAFALQNAELRNRGRGRLASRSRRAQFTGMLCRLDIALREIEKLATPQSVTGQNGCWSS